MWWMCLIVNLQELLEQLILIGQEKHLILMLFMRDKVQVEMNQSNCAQTTITLVSSLPPQAEKQPKWL